MKTKKLLFHRVWIRLPFRDSYFHQTIFGGYLDDIKKDVKRLQRFGFRVKMIPDTTEKALLHF